MPHLNSEQNPHDESAEFVSAEDTDDDLMLAPDDDDLMLAPDDEETLAAVDSLSTQKRGANIPFDVLSRDSKYWKVLVVDDEPEIHEVTLLALEGITFDKKSLTFVSAYSGEEAKQLLLEHPDTAVVLLDVVMESNNSGLEVTKYIRNQIDNQVVRIILRTGQPGEAPEESVIVDYDINDYKLKTDLSQNRLFTALIASLRSYRDLLELQVKHAEMEKLNHQLQLEIEERKKLEEMRFERERLRLEKELLEVQAKELTKLNADKDKFFSIVAHDLKGPFTPLMGNAELLMEMADYLPPKEIKEMSASIHRAAKNISYLLRNLLEWARMQMGRMEYQPSKVHLITLVDRNVTLLTPNATSKQINLVSQVGADLYVYADEYMIDTVIRNLTSNALKFTPAEGTVTIQARLQQKPLHQDKASKAVVVFQPNSPQISQFVEISISDTGVGIPAEAVNRLFQLGVYHSTRGTAQETGTGLGLIICHEMVLKNGGIIKVDSQVGQGSTFTFTLPVYVEI